MRPRFFSQKIAANDPEKKMPSTQANAIKRIRKGTSSVMYFIAQSAFFWMQGMFSIPLNRKSFSSLSCTYVSIRRL